MSKRLRTRRRDFMRQAVREAVQRAKVKPLEQKHRQGYLRRPVRTGEFSVWETEQVWTEP